MTSPWREPNAEDRLDVGAVLEELHRAVGHQHVGPAGVVAAQGVHALDIDAVPRVASSSSGTSGSAPGRRCPGYTPIGPTPRSCRASAVWLKRVARLAGCSARSAGSGSCCVMISEPAVVFSIPAGQVPEKTMSGGVTWP